ncbi:arylesterase [Nodosilinea sp. LEGE 06152]|uniref:GDSL-type esterase/lipase family protein n=1 Tax=Nodosilinea sp. LEGE 06152 TaxID=2777966 RepID=UPI00187F88E5|nr:GDSL-type esterase/lipase family protein [Nodosilinea sp. LEGE 06152]MBE9155879.1 arylesterase [Nodosilinea sp. LEGE 06152]
MRKILKVWFVMGGFGLLVLTGCDGPRVPSDQRVAQPQLQQQDTAARADVNNLYRGAGAQVVAFGDSITAGAGVGPQAAYPSLLSQRLGLPIVNLGRGGDTTATALDRLQRDVLAADPWLVMVGLGGNDFLQQVPLAQTEQNLREIVTHLQQQGAIVVLLGMNVYPFNGDYEAMYERVASETEAYLIPGVLEGLNDTRYLYDQIHPNQAGHQILADRVAEGLQPLLEQANRPASLSDWQPR